MAGVKRYGVVARRERKREPHTHAYSRRLAGELWARARRVFFTRTSHSISRIARNDEYNTRARKKRRRARTRELRVRERERKRASKDVGSLKDTNSFSQEREREVYIFKSKVWKLEILYGLSRAILRAGYAGIHIHGGSSRYLGPFKLPSR